MDFYTISLMLLAGFFHASWHAIVKSRSGFATLAGMGLVSGAWAVPVAAYSPVPNFLQCFLIIVSVIFHVGYKISLANAYNFKNFSKIYSVTRGLVPLITLILVLIIFGSTPSRLHIAGILVICIGAIGISYRAITQNLDWRLLSLGLMTSLMASIYSLIDGYGVKIGSGFFPFTSWLIIIDGSAFLLFSRFYFGDNLWGQIRSVRKEILGAGIFGTLSFVVFMWALSRNPTTEIVAFRECSVFFAVLIGIIFMQEPVKRYNLAMCGLIGLGLMIVAVAK